MRKTITIETVYQCNCHLGKETLHPLISVIDLSKAKEKQQTFLKLGFYTVLLKECKCESIIYGRKFYDYSDGTIIVLSPGESIDIENNNQMLCSQGWMLAFHYDLIKNSPLERRIQDYTFFNYQKKEALHLSSREKDTIFKCLESINEELYQNIDKYSKILIINKIELFLNYCTRFYNRQFITRDKANKDLLKKTELILNNYFQTDQARINGLPTSTYCARLLNLSPAYFEDLLKHETGKNTYEYIQFKQINVAKRQLLETNKTIGQIAEETGFSSSLHFTRLFKKITGYAPDKYRMPKMKLD